LTVVVTDGISTGMYSREAARGAADRALDELTRTDRPDRGVEQAHHDAAARAASWVAGQAMPGQVFPPGATYLAVRLAPAAGGASHQVTTAHLGDTRAYLLPADPATEPLAITTDHRGPTGELTASLDGNPRIPPVVSHTELSRSHPRLLVVTDGLGRLVAPGDLSGLPADPVRALSQLVGTREGTAPDDITAVVIGPIRP
ncbi:MAG: hypothetical protein ACRDQ0_01155, partial [Pseudonocardia sp.]